MTTNEEAFEKFFYNIFLHEMGFATEKESVKFIWQAAISYMQEQSEPEAWAWKARQTNGKIINRVEFWNPISQYPEANSIDVFDVRELYTTPQRQQPLKRLSDEVIDSLAKKGESWNEHGGWYFDADKFANAIMDAMQELNK